MNTLYTLCYCFKDSENIENYSFSLFFLLSFLLQNFLLYYPTWVRLKSNSLLIKKMVLGMKYTLICVVIRVLLGSSILPLWIRRIEESG